MTDDALPLPVPAETAAKPLRDATGRFLPGTAPGPGRRRRRTLHEVASERAEAAGTSLDAILGDIAEALFARARDGDVQAAKVCLDHLVARDVLDSSMTLEVITGVERGDLAERMRAAQARLARRDETTGSGEGGFVSTATARLTVTPRRDDDDDDMPAAPIVHTGVVRASPAPPPAPRPAPATTTYAGVSQDELRRMIDAFGAKAVEAAAQREGWQVTGDGDDEPDEAPQVPTSSLTRGRLRVNGSGIDQEELERLVDGRHDRGGGGSARRATGYDPFS